jgi:hypothetical protein
MQRILIFLLLAVSFYIKAQVIDAKQLFYNKCMSCHHQNGNTPIVFEKASDIIRLRKMILYTMEQNIMPPWRPDPNFSHFKNERVLNNEEKNTLKNWIISLDKKETLPTWTVPEKYNNNSKNTFTIKSTEKLFLLPNTKDTVINFEIPFSNTDSIDINQIEFFCNNLSLIHHVNYFVIDSTKIIEHLSDEMNSMSDVNLKESNIILGYAPGNFQHPFADSFGFTLPKSGIIRGDLHISQILSNLNFYFGFRFHESKIPVKYKMHLLSNLNCPQTKLNYDELVILPNEVRTFKNYSETQEDIRILYTHPHMHVYGKKMSSFAVTPNNDTIPIISINDWKFLQQEFYEYSRPLFIPAHSKIYLEATYDNTNNNLLNPFNPPRIVYEGSTTFEEMMLNLLLYY